MTMQCKYCGTNLPKDDARFCNNCGMLVPSHPLSPQSLSLLKNGSKHSFSSSPSEQQLHTAAIEEEGPLEKLPESTQPANQELSAAGPLVVHKPEATPVRPRPSQTSQQAPAWPLPVTHISMKEVLAEDRAAVRKLIPPTPVLYNATPVHEPQVNEQVSEENKGTVDIHAPLEAEEQVIEELPTGELAVPVEELPKDEAVGAIEELPTSELAVPVEELPTNETDAAIEELPTRQVAAVRGGQLPAHKQSVDVLPANQHALEPSEQPFTTEEPAQIHGISNSINPHASMIADTEAAPSGFPVVPPMSERSTIIQAAPPPLSPARPVRSLRMPIIIAAVLLVILIAAGVVAWVTIGQPFSVAPITQPQVGFSDAQLGVSLLYPNGWIKQSTAGAVHFYVSNHTADIDITVASNSSNVSQSLQQQVSKIGMSGAKAGVTLNFAGVGWQQLQGTVQQSGANYTDTLLAATHGGHLFIIMQQAPQNNYTDWEKEFFSPMRTSFKFL